jgi:hypothetical protein
VRAAHRNHRQRHPRLLDRPPRHDQNWQALLEIGHQTNERLLEAQLEACQCAPDAQTLERVVLPSTEHGQAASGLRFGDPRVMALLSCLCSFGHLFERLTTRSLRGLMAGLIPGYTARQMTYDLRRLRRKGLIRRHPRSQRYQLTPDGRRLAVFFSKTYARIVCPSLAELDPNLPKPSRAEPHPDPRGGNSSARSTRGSQTAIAA